MIDISLRLKILFLFLGLIVVSSITTISAVLYATNKSVEEQAQEKLKVGLNVFEQLMDIRSNQLFDSAEVLTADFGFKAAVLDNDQATVLSVLENHGARIDADLMMLATLDGELIASTDRTTHQKRNFPFKVLLPEAESEGGLMSIVMLNGNAYQMLMLPVNAPVPVAWTVVGFLIDQELANQLKELTNLDVTFTGDLTNNTKPLASTAPSLYITTISNISSSDERLSSEEWQRGILADHDYLSLRSSLTDTQQYQVNAILRTSLDEAFEQFSPLRVQMLTISGLALTLSVIIGFFIARNVTRPVNYLVSSAERISSGDYSKEIPFSHCKHNEIGKLASSFSLMQKGIAEREEKILYQVYHDSLTGLSNRISVQEQLDHLLSNDLEETSLFTLLSINIRQFKQINDTFGYQIGDELLKAIGTKLKALSEQASLKPARIGGDEFLLILSHSPEEDITDKALSVLKIINTHYHINNLDIPVNVTAGLASYPAHGNKTNQLLRRVDIALNNAKNKKQELAIYEVGEDEKYLNQIRLVNDLKTAISKNQLTMFYQPKVDLKKKEVTQVEALIRWFHPELGFIRPDEFIGLAEQSGLMPALSRWVLRTVLSDAASWKEQEVNLAMAVNLSAYDLAHDDLPEYVDQLLAEKSLTSEDLILEVTESAVMDDPDQALNVLNQFKRKGIKLAIDDYGTGYSSLSQLKLMPVDELKIDMSFVLKLDKNPDDQAIVQSTIEMGHNLGLYIVAEGVENRASWELLEKYGCDKLQGYYISKPQSSEDFLSWYKQYNVSDEYITSSSMKEV